jgi:NitT/TauT family transport system substrate-binding protein
MKWSAIVALLLGLVPVLLLAQDDMTGLAADAELVESRMEVPRLQAPAAYEMKDKTIDVELSEYAGYAGLIVANGGMEPNENSLFYKRHGFKVRLTLSEEESWSALNSGRLAASATTADVLAVYGKQFQVVVPAQIGFSRGADGIVVRSNINRINDLKGKVLATAQFTEADFFIRYLAQEAGIAVHILADLKEKPNPDAVNLVYCADAFGAGDLFLRDVQAGRTRLAGCVTWAPKTTEVAEASEGKAKVLVTNRNLLIVADILIVNKGFAEANPDIVRGLVDGLLEGNRLVRSDPKPHLDLLARSFGWEKSEVAEELQKVHLSNLPENQAFFSGAIDAAGSFGGIYQSAIYAYGSNFIRNPQDAERFLDLKHLKALAESGVQQGEKVAIAPIRSPDAGPVERDPLLSKDIRFFFQPNSAILDMENQDNIANLAAIKQMLQVSPGSSVLLRGHVDNSQIEKFRRDGGEALVRQMALKAMELSKQRAEEIKKHLRALHSLPEDRIVTVGRGWDEPAGTDPDANRRVEVQWFTLE